MIERDPKPSSKEPDGAPPDGYVDPAKVVFLDPARAVRAGGRTLLPTAYMADRLLVRSDVVRLLTDDPPRTSEALGMDVEFRTVRCARVAPTDVPGLSKILGADTLEIVPNAGLNAGVDAWDVLQRLQASSLADEQTLRSGISLDHVMTSCGGGYTPIGGGYTPIGGGYTPIGGGYTPIGGGYTPIGGPAEYGVPGRGGRMPVTLPLLDPWVRGAEVRPVVALLDSGVGHHPWFSGRVEVPSRPKTSTWFDGDVPLQVGAVWSGQTSGGATTLERIGGINVDGGTGVTDPMTGAFAPLAGHGTFVAGIVRMGCPSARILSVPVLSSDGLAEEGFVLHTLLQLLDMHLRAVVTGNEEGVIDVLSISLGYYHEDSDRPGQDSDLAAVLAAFGRIGVLVVAGAGNDATTRPMLPAGFARRASPHKAAVPLTSVGALNPDSRSVALFSNDGDWVVTRRRGAAVVSTLPTTIDAGGEGGARAEGPSGSRPDRSLIDPDAYGGGFGVWSGTSFATPTLAAELALLLTRRQLHEPEDRVKRSLGALAQALGERP